MKILSYGLLVSTLFFAACSNTPKEQHSTMTDTSTTTKSSIKSTSNTASAVSGILASYLELKNALTKDDDKAAATSGKALETALGSFDKSGLTAEQGKAYTDIQDDAKEHAEHIAANTGNIAHQREHFDMLSKDVYDLTKLLGAGQSLYVDHCPMYNNNKGAIWLSEVKDIH